MNIVHHLRRLLPVLAIVGLSSLMMACSSVSDRVCTNGGTCTQTISIMTVEGSAATAVILDDRQLDPATGQPTGPYRRTTSLMQSPGAAQLAVSIIAPVAAAATGGALGYITARDNPCARGGCGGGGGVAIAVSNSGARADAAGYAGINFGQPAPSGH